MAHTPWNKRNKQIDRSLTPQSYEQARQLFFALCDLPPAMQHAKLAAAPLDPRLQQIVLELLEADRDPRGLRVAIPRLCNGS